MILGSPFSQSHKKAIKFCEEESLGGFFEGFPGKFFLRSASHAVEGSDKESLPGKEIFKKACSPGAQVCDDPILRKDFHRENFVLISFLSPGSRRTVFFARKFYCEFIGHSGFVYGIPRPVRICLSYPAEGRYPEDGAMALSSGTTRRPNLECEPGNADA
jgi:hypothetical protein